MGRLPALDGWHAKLMQPAALSLVMAKLNKQLCGVLLQAKSDCVLNQATQ
jgi:hypothetical protein